MCLGGPAGQAGHLGAAVPGVRDQRGEAGPGERTGVRTCPAGVWVGAQGWDLGLPS